MEKSTYGQFEIVRGQNTLTDVPAMMRSSGQLPKHRIVPPIRPLTPRAEEEEIGRQDIRTASSLFERNRVPVREALRAIVESSLRKYQIPYEAGLDVGSGATGEMVEELLPKNKIPSQWVQMDANPSAVAANKQRHPGSNIVRGSYLNLGVKGLNLVTGLSSLDATLFLDQAVDQIADALAPGGFLFHMQDVRPGSGFGIREMQRMGVQPPFNAEYLSGPHDVLCYDLPGGRKIDVGECFRREIGRVIQANPKLELLDNRWVTTVRPSPTPQLAKWYFLNILLQAGPIEDPMEEVSAIVTVARKK